MIKDHELKEAFKEAFAGQHLTPAERNAAELAFCKGYIAGVKLCTEKLIKSNAKHASIAVAAANNPFANGTRNV